MYKGRDRHRELIEELQSTQALEQEDHEEKTHMINLRQLQNDQSMQEARLCEILDSLEGKTVCGTLDFLSKVNFVSKVNISFTGTVRSIISFVCRNW